MSELGDFGIEKPLPEKERADRWCIKTKTAYCLYDNKLKVVYDMAIDFNDSCAAREEMEQLKEKLEQETGKTYKLKEE